VTFPRKPDEVIGPRSAIYATAPLEFVHCAVHGARSPATVNLTAYLTYRARCRACHAAAEMMRRHRNLPRYNEYARAWRARRRAQRRSRAR
jgi:hypothetical protein